MWKYSVKNAGLNIAAIGSMFVIRPSLSSVKPVGVFIHEFAETIKNVEAKPLNASGMPQIKCARRERRFQPYR